jgi:hypothetical protein
MAASFNFHWSTQMFKSTLGIAVLASLIGLAGCASRAETVGTFGGAAVGAGVGGGTIGTLGGAMVGYAAGRAYDEHNR